MVVALPFVVARFTLSLVAELQAVLLLVVSPVFPVFLLLVSAADTLRLAVVHTLAGFLWFDPFCCFCIPLGLVLVGFVPR